ncbi:MAG: toxic anion resistance protein, partial [Roseovarius sp.]
MSDTTRRQAEAVLSDVDSVSRAVLPEPTDANAIVSLEKADATQSAEISRRMAEIDMADTQSI